MLSVAVFSGVSRRADGRLAGLIGEQLGVERLADRVLERSTVAYHVKIGDSANVIVEDVVLFGVEGNEPREGDRYLPSGQLDAQHRQGRHIDVSTCSGFRSRIEGIRRSSWEPSRGRPDARCRGGANSHALARVALAGPRGEDQQQACVLGGADLAALVGVELGEQAAAAADRLAARLAELDRAVDDDQPGPLVDLVLVELLAGGELDRDRASLLGRDPGPPAGGA